MRAGDKKLFTRPISGNKTTFFWPYLYIWPAGERELTAIGGRVQIFNL